MSTIDAFHLPGLRDADFDGWHSFPAGASVARAPRLTAAGLLRVTARLRAAGERLRALPVETVVDAIDAVAQRILTNGDPIRTTALAGLPPLTGYSPAMIAHIVDRMAADWRRPQLQRLLAAELDDRTLAVPYRLVAHVFAGNVPGVAVTSLVRALLVRAPSLGKTAAGEPLLAPLFARALAEHDTAIGDALAITYWPGGDEEMEQTAWAEADAIVAYGGAAALAGIRSRAPARTPVIDHGPRLSIGFITGAALASESAAEALAEDVARAVATFDQQGCVSPHAVFVEDGMVGAEAFAHALADALARIETVLPRGTLTAGEAAAIRDVHSRAEFGRLAGRDIALVSPPDAPFTVVLHGSPAFEPSCLQRTIHVHRVASIAQALDALQPHRDLLQSAALADGDARDEGVRRHVAGGDRAGDNSRLVTRIAAAGFTRITTFVRMPWPDPAGPHDGRGPLRELLRLVAVELD